MPSLFSTHCNVNLTIIAPSAEKIPDCLPHYIPDEGLRRKLVDEVQRFRGRIFVQDNSLPASALDAQGRHNMPYDDEAWHLLVWDRYQNVCGAMRVGIHLQKHRPVRLEDLQISKFLAHLPTATRSLVEGAARAYLRRIRSPSPFFEPGGWVIAENARKSTLASVLAAAVWSLGRAVGGSAGLSMATMKNNSASILKKMGGFELFSRGVPLAPFFDPYHGSQMELIGFDPSYLNPRLEATVAEIQEFINVLPIITGDGTRGAATRPQYVPGHALSAIRPAQAM
jgi:hypothetical protein